jgi:hypothetical protein
MFELAKNEFSRYQKWALLWAIVLICGFVFSMKFRPLLAPSMVMSAFNHLLLLGGSFLFGAGQMLLHRRKNHWTFLIHRPIAPLAIFSALFMAGALVVFIAVGLPWLLTIAGLDLFGKGVVDARHYSYAFYLFFAALFAYQIGILVMLNASKGAITLVMIIVVILAPNATTHIGQFGPAILFNIVLFYLNSQSFKPDLSTYLRKPLSQILIAVPMSFVMVFVLQMSTMVYYHVPKYMTSSHPDDNPQEGSLRYIYSLKRPDYAKYVLNDANIKDPALAQSIQQQWELADQAWFSAGATNFPHQQQLHVYDTSYAISDEDGIANWQFSHKHMALVGHNATTGEFVGVIGKSGFSATLEDFQEAGDAAMFASVPFIVFTNFLIFEDKIMTVNFDEKRLLTRFELPEGEKFVDSPGNNFGGKTVSVLTNKRLMVFDAQIFNYEYAELLPNFAVELPVTAGSIAGLLGSELADGFAFLLLDSGNYGREGEAAYVMHVDYLGNSTLVSSRKFDVKSHPAWIEQFNYMVSPVLFIARGAILTSIDPNARLPVNTEGVSVQVEAIVLHIMSLILLLLIGRKHNLNKMQWATWIVMVAVMSLPAVISFVLLHPFKGVYFKRRQKKALSLKSQVA